MVTATVAEATRYGVTIKRTSGETVTVLRADLADASRPHGVNLDEAEELVERAGYVSGVWRWRDGYYKTVVVSETQLAGRRGRDRAQGDANERKARLEIARTGKRPSGKPLTSEMQRWVQEYKAGKRDF